MANDTLFRELAPRIMRGLMAEFSLDATSAAAIVGNLGHESGGFRFLQEIKPLIPGSKGGYGWAQWTGPRRRAYEKYCADKKLDPASYEANYGFLVWELRNTETSAIPAVKRATTLHGKVVAFELAFERASDQHKGYPSRERWANIALSAFSAGAPVKPPASPDLPKPKPPPVTPPAKPGDAKAVGILAAIGAVIAAAWTWFLEYLPEILLGLAVLIALAAIIFRLMKGHWPWTSLLSPGVQSPAQLPLSRQNSDRSSDQLSDLLAALPAPSSGTPLPEPLAFLQPRKRSAKRSRKTRKPPRGSKSLKRSTPTRSLRKRKSRSSAPSRKAKRTGRTSKR